MPERVELVNLFNMGILELLVILGLAVIIFGPDRMLRMAGSLRKTVSEAQRQASEVTASAIKQAGASEKEAQGQQQGERAEFTPESKGPEGDGEGR